MTVKFNYIFSCEARRTRKKQRQGPVEQSVAPFLHKPCTHCSTRWQITTREPDDDQLEVALVALRCVLGEESQAVQA